jgi:hypothetical protein
VSCVTVDSDEEHRSPIKPRGGNPIFPISNVHYLNNQNNGDNQNHHQMGNGNASNHQANEKHGSNARDVKPELITSYASQKKRLLAKAQSECLINMKQEPGVHDMTSAASNGHSPLPKTIKGYFNGYVNKA